MRKLIKTNSTSTIHANLRVEITESALRGIIDTIGRHPPERFGILGGSLDVPFRITDYRYCPPRRDRSGRYDHGTAHVNVDADFMNFVIDEEWRPNGKYLVGIVHSHPGGMKNLSYGDEASNEGDFVFFKNCLRHDDSPERNWKYLIAPIVTFNPAGIPDMNVWVVTLDDPEPRKAELVPIPDVAERAVAEPATAAAFDPGLPLPAILSLAETYQRAIDAIDAQQGIDVEDREANTALLRRLRSREFDDIAQGNHPLGQYVNLRG
jgi:proteasome lid subunit RPN8/RPN11